jgi:hypothetical protein
VQGGIVRDKFFKMRQTDADKKRWVEAAFAANFPDVSAFVRAAVQEKIASVTEVSTVPSTQVREKGGDEEPSAVASPVPSSPFWLPVAVQVAEGVPPARPGAVVTVQGQSGTPCPRHFLHVPGIVCGACGK